MGIIDKIKQVFLVRWLKAAMAKLPQKLRKAIAILLIFAAGWLGAKYPDILPSSWVQPVIDALEEIENEKETSPPPVDLSNFPPKDAQRKAPAVPQVIK